MAGMLETDATSLTMISKPENKTYRRMKMKEEYFDAVIVYAKGDDNLAKEVQQNMQSLFLNDFDKPKVCLFDHPQFGGSSVNLAMAMIDICEYIFVLLTPNFIDDKVAEFLKEELVCETRIGDNVQCWQKYCVRPLHTQSASKGRNYKMPFGLASIVSYDVYDFENDHTRRKLIDLFNHRLHIRKDREKKSNVLCEEENSLRINGNIINTPTTTSLDNDPLGTKECLLRIPNQEQSVDNTLYSPPEIINPHLNQLPLMFSSIEFNTTNNISTSVSSTDSDATDVRRPPSDGMTDSQFATEDNIEQPSCTCDIYNDDGPPTTGFSPLSGLAMETVNEDTSMVEGPEQQFLALPDRSMSVDGHKSGLPSVESPMMKTGNETLKTDKETSVDEGISTMQDEWMLLNGQNSVLPSVESPMMKKDKETLPAQIQSTSNMNSQCDPDETTLMLISQPIPKGSQVLPPKCQPKDDAHTKGVPSIPTEDESIRTMQLWNPSNVLDLSKEKDKDTGILEGRGYLECKEFAGRIEERRTEQILTVRGDCYSMKKHLQSTAYTESMMMKTPDFKKSSPYLVKPSADEFQNYAEIKGQTQTGKAGIQGPFDETDAQKSVPAISSVSTTNIYIYNSANINIDNGQISTRDDTDPNIQFDENLEDSPSLKKTENLGERPLSKKMRKKKSRSGEHCKSSSPSIPKAAEISRDDNSSVQSQYSKGTGSSKFYSAVSDLSLSPASSWTEAATQPAADSPGDSPSDKAEKVEMKMTDETKGDNSDAESRPAVKKDVCTPEIELEPEPDAQAKTKCSCFPFKLRRHSKKKKHPGRQKCQSPKFAITDILA